MSGYKRKIFYLSGFDPRGARFYHQMFGEQADRFCATTGHMVAVGKREKLPPHSTRWSVKNAGQDSKTDYVYLGWDDVVRHHWVKNPFRLVARSIRAYWHFLTRVDWSIFRRFPQGTKITIYYPGVSAILLPILCGLLLWLPARWLIDWPWDLAIATAIGVAVGLIIVRKIQGFWLIRFIIFNDMLARRGLPDDVAERMNEFARMIARSFDEPWDEILLVSHSNGSIMSIPILDRLIAVCGRALPDHFSFVSLGSCITLVSARRDATAFRAALDRVSQADFRWLDLNSITDGACIAGLDPCVTCPADRRVHLLQLSPRWFKYIEPAAYKAQKRNKYEVHFNYFRSFDRVSALDYMAMSTGARSLPDSIEAFRADTDA